MKKYWRKNGVYFLVATYIVGRILDMNGVMGASVMLFMTIPCGIMIFNKNKVLHIIRQLCFFIIGLLWVLKCIT